MKHRASLSLIVSGDAAWPAASLGSELIGWFSGGLTSVWDLIGYQEGWDQDVFFLPPSHHPLFPLILLHRSLGQQRGDADGNYFIYFHIYIYVWYIFHLALAYIAQPYLYTDVVFLLVSFRCNTNKQHFLLMSTLYYYMSSFCVCGCVFLCPTSSVRESELGAE